MIAYEEEETNHTDSTQTTDQSKAKQPAPSTIISGHIVRQEPLNTKHKRMNRTKSKDNRAADSHVHTMNTQQRLRKVGNENYRELKSISQVPNFPRCLSVV